jgi:hypothetical protein
MTPFQIGFIGWLLYIALCVGYNYWLIEIEKKHPNYLGANIWRCFWGVVFLIGMNPDFDPANYLLYQLLKVFPTAVYEAASFYLLFDPSLNIARRKPALYRGAHSGWLDSLPVDIYYVLKIVSLIGLVWSITKIF